jgi:hypothetical protein
MQPASCIESLGARHTGGHTYTLNTTVCSPLLFANTMLGPSAHPHAVHAAARLVFKLFLLDDGLMDGKGELPAYITDIANLLRNKELERASRLLAEELQTECPAAPVTDALHESYKGWLAKQSQPNNLAFRALDSGALVFFALRPLARFAHPDTVALILLFTRLFNDVYGYVRDGEQDLNDLQEHLTALGQLILALDPDQRRHATEWAADLITYHEQETRYPPNPSAAAQARTMLLLTPSKAHDALRAAVAQLADVVTLPPAPVLSPQRHCCVWR